jgi:hypothetical protein
MYRAFPFSKESLKKYYSTGPSEKSLEQTMSSSKRMEGKRIFSCLRIIQPAKRDFFGKKRRLSSNNRFFIES